MKGLPRIKVWIQEVDTCGVNRIRMQGMEYVRVEVICDTFKMTPHELFEKIVNGCNGCESGPLFAPVPGGGVENG